MKNFISMILIIVVIWWVIEYYVLNSYLFLFKNTPNFFNNLLYNPLNKYHPILFFSSYIFLYNTVSYANFFSNHRTLNSLDRIGRYMYIYTSFKNNVYWIVILFSLYLGSWWAIQEGSWGGWWNWDASEVFGLLILTILLIILHNNTNYTPYITQLYTLLLSSLYILFIYLILQLSYTLVSHNFGLSILSYGYVSMTFLTLLYVTIICIIVLIFIYSSSLKCVLNSLLKFTISMSTKLRYEFFTLTSRYFILTYLIYTTLYIYILSFNPILNNIFWTSLSIEIFNSLFTPLNVKVIILIIILTLLIQYSWLLLLLTVVYASTYPFVYTTVILILNRSYSLVKITHITIVILLLLPLSVPNTVCISWELLNESVINWFNSYYRLVFRNNYFTNNVYISDTLNTYKSSNVSTPNSFFWFSNNLDTQFFELDLTTNLLRQVIHNHTYMYTFKVSIWDITPLVVDLYTWFIFINVLYFYTSKFKIIF
jgi:hypothetical protein